MTNRPRKVAVNKRNIISENWSPARPVRAYSHEVGLTYCSCRRDVDGGQSGGPIAANRVEPAAVDSGRAVRAQPSS